MYQIKTNKEKVEYYPNDGSLIWANYSIDWTEHLKKAVGPNGDVSEEGIRKVFNGNIRNIPETMLKEAETKIRTIREGWKTSHPAVLGNVRPALGIYEVKMARCGCCFNNAELYNEHMRSIHGIDTFLKEDFRPAPHHLPPLQAYMHVWMWPMRKPTTPPLPEWRNGPRSPYAQNHEIQPGKVYYPAAYAAQTRKAGSHRRQGRSHHIIDKLWQI